MLPWKIATVTTASDFSEKSCRMNAVKILTVANWKETSVYGNN